MNAKERGIIPKLDNVKSHCLWMPLSAFLYITVLMLAHKHKYKHTNGGSYFQSKERDKRYDEKRVLLRIA